MSSWPPPPAHKLHRAMVESGCYMKLTPTPTNWWNWHVLGPCGIFKDNNMDAMPLHPNIQSPPMPFLASLLPVPIIHVCTSHSFIHLKKVIKWQFTHTFLCFFAFQIIPFCFLRATSKNYCQISWYSYPSTHVVFFFQEEKRVGLDFHFQSPHWHQNQ